MSKFNYKWNLKDGYPEKNGLKVFSCFSCAGGSTMGYKLAGYDVIGCNEIDPSMMEIYKKNHNPKYSFNEPIQEFKTRSDIPEELFDIDVLDGSPPCSSFSMMGAREKHWGKEKKFREGQAVQILDDLFFHFIDVAEKLQPKMVIAENVEGILAGSAQKYLREIERKFTEIGFTLFVQILDASKMGVPQRRKRVFFFAFNDKKIDAPMFFNLEFNEKSIPFSEFIDMKGRSISGEKTLARWKKRIKSDKSIGDIVKREENIISDFGTQILHSDRVLQSLTAKCICNVHYDHPIHISESECITGQSFPQDFDFCDKTPFYFCGMSVPPVMMANIASQILTELI